MPETVFEGALQGVYDAALDPSRWEQALWRVVAFVEGGGGPPTAGALPLAGSPGERGLGALVAPLSPRLGDVPFAALEGPAALVLRGVALVDPAG